MPRRLRDVAQDPRPALLAWAQDIVATHHTFQSLVLKGTLSQEASSQLWKLGSLDEDSCQHFKKLVADFMGVEREWRLRNLREFAEHMAVVLG